jgi:hypothetical protein
MSSDHLALVRMTSLQERWIKRTVKTMRPRLTGKFTSKKACPPIAGGSRISLAWSMLQ